MTRPPPLLCTHDECSHERSWPTREDRRADLTEHPEWVETETGYATCACHWPAAAQPTFPCDQATRRRFA